MQQLHLQTKMYSADMPHKVEHIKSDPLLATVLPSLHLFTPEKCLYLFIPTLMDLFQGVQYYDAPVLRVKNCQDPMSCLVRSGPIVNSGKHDVLYQCVSFTHFSMSLYPICPQSHLGKTKVDKTITSEVSSYSR